MSVVVQRHQFTVDDYARMLDTGILNEHDRVELIDGEVRQMCPIGSLHVSIVNRLNAILTRQLADRAIVSVQNPVILNNLTEPEPDLVVLRAQEDFYEDALAGPADVLLVIEVADSSLEYDRDEKIPRYALAQIPEMWLVDANDRKVTQYARSEGNRYQHVREFVAGTELVSTEITALSLSINELFRIGR